VDAAHDLAVPAGSPPGSSWGEVRRGDEVLARWVVLPESDALLTTVVLGAVAWDRCRLADDGWRPVLPEDRPAGTVAVTPVRAAGAAPAVRLGPLGRASAPDDWSSAAHLDLALPEADGSSLVLDWAGDVARLFDEERLVADAFFTGREWRVPAADIAGARRLRAEILPLPADAPVRIGRGRPDGATITAARWEKP
jgi:beta-galactosidase